MTPSPVFDPVRIVSFILSVVAILVLWQARKRMDHRYVANQLMYICVHFTAYYGSLLVGRIYSTFLPDDFFTNWSALLRLHEVITTLLIAIYLLRMPHYGTNN
jgi:hypothetical protein